MLRSQWGIVVSPICGGPCCRKHNVVHKMKSKRCDIIFFFKDWFEELISVFLYTALQTLNLILYEERKKSNAYGPPLRINMACVFCVARPDVSVYILYYIQVLFFMLACNQNTKRKTERGRKRNFEAFVSVASFIRSIVLFFFLSYFLFFSFMRKR